ncbi:MAG TPA: hypothetical protein VE907_12265 [Gammaproteobacteria bacterium]|nr:hypothetical protein [Gammaproteobacteria bacterium]
MPDPGGLSQEQRQAVQQEVGAYFEAMKAYTACLQAELVVAGGDDAPRYRAALINRNNAAVAEAEVVLKVLETYAPLPANPGAEAALRRLIDGYVQGKFNYDLMTPEVAADVRKIEAGFRKQISSFGTFESVTFLSTNVLGADVYLVRFADGPMMWEIGLTADGKTSRSAMHVCMEGGRLVDPRSVPRCRPPDYSKYCASPAGSEADICAAVRRAPEQRGVDGRETPP